MFDRKLVSAFRFHFSVTRRLFYRDILNKTLNQAEKPLKEISAITVSNSKKLSASRTALMLNTRWSRLPGGGSSRVECSAVVGQNKINHHWCRFAGSWKQLRLMRQTYAESVLQL